MPAGPDNDDFLFSILGSRRRRRPSCARDERLASRHVISHADYPRACARECQRSPRWQTRHHDRRCRITLGGSGLSKMTWVPPSWTGATTRGAGAGMRYSRAPLARIPRACMRIMLTGSDGDADTVVRPARGRVFPRNFPLGCPGWCRPGGSLACPVGAPSATDNPDKKVWARTRGSTQTSAARRSGYPSVRVEGVGAGHGGGSGGGEWARGSWLAGGDDSKPLRPRASCSVESEPGSESGAFAVMG